MNFILLILVITSLTLTIISLVLLNKFSNLVEKHQQLIAKMIIEKN